MRRFARTRRMLHLPLMALLFFVAQAAWAATNRTLEIYVENAADPFSKPDGTGYANDVVKAAFEAVGVPIRFHVAPYARCKYMAISGEAAACVSMSWDPSFAGRIRFADTPLIAVTPVYYENPSHPLTARSEAQLGKGIVIGTVRGYEYPESAMKVKDRGAVFDENSSEQANLEKLALGRLDAVMVMSNHLTGHSHWALDAHVTHLVRIAFASATCEYGYFGASTKHPDGLAALKQYNDGIRIITANGRLDQIRAKWTPHKPD